MPPHSVFEPTDLLLQHLQVGKRHHDWIELLLPAMLNRRTPDDGTFVQMFAEAVTSMSAHSPLAEAPPAGVGGTSTLARWTERR